MANNSETAQHENKVPDMRSILPLMSEFVEKYSSEIGSKNFETEIEMLISGTDRLIDFVVLNDINVIVLTDKSARYLRPLLDSRYKVRFPGEQLPKVCFINVGTEKQSSAGFDEEFLSNSETVKHVSKGLSPFIRSRSNICVVDDFACSGGTLRNTKKLIKKAFPTCQVFGTYALDGEPFWTPFDDLKDVVDIYEYINGGARATQSFFTKPKRTVVTDPRFKDIGEMLVTTNGNLPGLLRKELSLLALSAPIPELKESNKKPFIPACINPSML